MSALSDGPWETAAEFTLPLLVLYPFGLIRRRPIATGGWPLVQADFLMAACSALKADTLLRSYVARVIRLFYFTPKRCGTLWRSDPKLNERIFSDRAQRTVRELLAVFRDQASGAVAGCKTRTARA